MSNHTTHHDGCDCVMDKMQKLEAENDRLREALKSIASEDHPHHIDSECWYKVGIEGCSEVLANDTQIAREALKGGE